MSQFQARAAVAKALAHPSRLIMLDALEQGEKCVCDLQKLVGADISTVSKHLSVLKAAGLVVDRKEGLWVYYRLTCPCLGEFMRCVDGVIERQKRADELKDRPTTGCFCG